jgi:hypothetical protein
MPGPNELKGQQMNHCFEPSMKEIGLLKNSMIPAFTDYCEANIDM